MRSAWRAPHSANAAHVRGNRDYCSAAFDIFSGLFPVFSLAIALTLVTPVTPPRGSYWLMIVSIAGAVISFIYFFFAFRASFQAADNPESAPEWARWDVLAFMIFLIFVVLLFISTMWYFLRSWR
jgi:hypothetical protein